MTKRNHPALCIIPPHMLKEIAERGSPEQRETAVKTLRFTSQFRGVRQEFTGFPRMGVPKSPDGKQRIVYHADFDSALPGRMVRSEGSEPSGDPAVDEAYDGAGITYDLFCDVYQRLSIDDRNMRIDSTVHYQKGYDNAFWNGAQMVYGDGDEDLPLNQRLFNRFTMSLDVIGHELTHGVIQYEANLNYWEQSGALNESIADVFGSLVKQRHRAQTAGQADWIIGEGLFTANVQGKGIRSMKAPGTAYDDPVLGKDPQPAHMRDYQNVPYDNGGVHINSGIPNHAFYITAVEMGGYAWEKAGRIWYIALCDKLQNRSSFQDAALLTQEVAGTLYGAGSLEQRAVRKGWSEVGIYLEATAPSEGCLPALIRALTPKAAR